MKIYRLLISFMAIIISTSVLIYAGSVQVKVDNTHISKGEELKVSIIAKGSNVEFPNISKIGPYTIQSPRQSQNVNITYNNGKLSKIQQKIYTFVIYPESNVTIPPFEVKVDGKIERTKPTSIYVGSGSGNTATSSKGYSLTMNISKKSTYVGEPILLQVVFFEPRNSDIAQAQYIPPKFDGFFVKSNKNERLQNNKNGTAHIFDYILTPQKAGKFTIPAPQIKIGIQTFTGANDPWGFFNNEVHWRNIKGNSRAIEVKALPQNVDLVGSFNINAKVDKQTTKANKPVNYTLAIEGTGSLEDMEDPAFDIDGVTVYSDDAKTTTEIIDGKIHGTWIKKYTFIGDQDFTIPSVQKTIFDPNKGNTQTISSKAFNIRVEGGSSAKNTSHPKPQHKSSTGSTSGTGQTPTTTPTPQNAHRPPQAKDNNRSLLEDVDYYRQQEEAKAKTRLPWWSLLISFVLGVVLGVMGKKWIPSIGSRSRKTTIRNYTPQEALDLLYPHTNDSKEIEEMVRQLYRAQKDSSVKIDKEKLQRLIVSILG